MVKIQTVRDAMRPKALALAAMLDADRRAAADRDSIAATLAARPDIGQLCRNGAPVFYSFASGAYRERRDPRDL